MTVTAETCFMTKHCHFRVVIPTNELCLLHNLHGKLGRMTALKAEEWIPERNSNRAKRETFDWLLVKPAVECKIYPG
jgi:hypothetical protein